MDETWRALADPTRRQMVDRLRRGSLTAGQLGEGTSISQPAVSRHLKVLRDAGVVSVQPAGRTRLFSLEPATLAAVDAWLEPYRALWEQRLDALETEVRRGRRGSGPPCTSPRSEPPEHRNAKEGA